MKQIEERLTAMARFRAREAALATLFRLGALCAVVVYLITP